MGDPADEKLLGVCEVSKYLRLSRSSIARYIELGLLVPDVVEPDAPCGRSGPRKFKKSTVVAFEHRLWEACERGVPVTQLP